MSIGVSAIVMTKNEARNITKCLRSLQRIDQILVVDSGSTDGTKEIAKKLGATVVDFQWNGQYPKKKQWCLENLPFDHDWVFFVDADEEATPELLNEIGHQLATQEGTAGYFVGYDYVFLGRTLRHGQRVFKLVLFDRHLGRFEPVDDLEAENMWEVEGHYQPCIDGPTATLGHSMIHTDHDSLFHFFDRHNRYSDWEALVRTKAATSGAHESQIGGRAAMKRAFNRLPFKAPIAFIYGYVIKRGFLDGRAGLHYALAKAFYYWQIEIKMAEGRRSRDASND
jgi:glycosyltransferase involved in cell wall biosynthesis